ncbi:MAG: ribonuclease HI family protein [Bacillota bacterium]|jgi:ribonuclease HI
MTVYTDGASRGNPGLAGIGLVFFGSDGQEIKRIHRFLGTTTNNVAEYTALLTALEQALTMNVGQLNVFSDSELMVRQMNGEYKVRDEKLIPLYQQARQLASKFSKVTYTHIPRSRNKIADQLANQAIDERNS